MGPTRMFCLYLVTAAAWSTCGGQEKPFDVCGVSVHAADPSAQTLVEQILQKLVQRPDTILVFASTDPGVADRSGAVSSECPMGNGMQRWIVYDPEVIPVGPELDFALAHETAHHVNRHLLNGDTRTKQQELEADEYGARYLTRLGWDDKRLLGALDGLKLPLPAKGGYPSLDERKAAVIAGYKKEAADVISDQDKSDIGQTLNRYADILTKRKAKALKDVWPTVPAGTVNTFQSFIDSSRNLSLSIAPNKWEHYGTGILVTCQQTQSFERNGKQTIQDSPINFYMVKSQGAWIISDIPVSSN
jgi:hypothetical protein